MSTCTALPGRVQPHLVETSDAGSENEGVQVEGAVVSFSQSDFETGCAFKPGSSLHRPTVFELLDEAIPLAVGVRGDI